MALVQRWKRLRGWSRAHPRLAGLLVGCVAGLPSGFLGAYLTDDSPPPDLAQPAAWPAGALEEPVGVETPVVNGMRFRVVSIRRGDVGTVLLLEPMAASGFGQYEHHELPLGVLFDSKGKGGLGRRAVESTAGDGRIELLYPPVSQGKTTLGLEIWTFVRHTFPGAPPDLQGPWEVRFTLPAKP